jgi:hypothetical protein
MQRHRQIAESAPEPSASPRSLRLTMSPVSRTGIQVSGHAEQIAPVRQSISGRGRRTATRTAGLRQRRRAASSRII